MSAPADLKSTRRQIDCGSVATTITFSVCFAVWVLNSVLTTFLVRNGLYHFGDFEFGCLLAAPILTGALSRIPLGTLTDRYGGRIVVATSMLCVTVPLYLVSYADGFWSFLLLSLGFGIVGGSFIVGIGQLPLWNKGQRQKTTMELFGIGNAGVAITSLLAPQLLQWLTAEGQDLEAWRLLPRVYAGGLLVTAVLFFCTSRSRLGSDAKCSWRNQRLPLSNRAGWQLGLYTILCLGAFLALVQWIVPYASNVYHLSLTQAGALAALFSLSAGVVQACGGWLVDRYGARTAMLSVLWLCFFSCLFLSVPPMDIQLPSTGIEARSAGEVTAVSTDRILVGSIEYRLEPPPAHFPVTSDDGKLFTPKITEWQEPIVQPGIQVRASSLLAKGIKRIHFPANLWLFAAWFLIFGIAIGLGTGSVYRLLAEPFPDAAGTINTVGITVESIGALGGAVLPLIFGQLLSMTGLWTTCWLVLAAISLVCTVWMYNVRHNIFQNKAPALSELLEHPPTTAVPDAVDTESNGGNLEAELRRCVPILQNLTPEAMQSVLAHGKVRMLPEATELFRQGECGDYWYCIIEGRIRIFAETHTGTARELTTFQAGETLGELALLDNEPRSATATTVTPCRLFLMPRRQFIEIISTNTAFLAQLLRRLVNKIRYDTMQMLAAELEKEHIRTEQEVDRRRAISQMVAGVAHEINTPIGIANHAASFIGELLKADNVATGLDTATIEELRQASKLIMDSITRAGHLVSTFKSLSVNQARDVKDTVSLSGLTQESIELFRFEARRKNLQIKIDNQLDREADRWEGYPALYTQVMLNLLANGEKHAYPAGQGGVIEITLRQEEQTKNFIVTVRDHGCGIAQENMPQLFEPFFTTNRAQGGTGLGLAIVKNVVSESFGGTISIESRLNEGTTVTLRLPAVIVSKP